MSKFLMLHGYGHDMMGKNPNGKHGSTTMEMLDDMLLKKAKELNVEVESFQNNDTKVVSDRIFSASAEFDGILFNPASCTGKGVRGYNAGCGAGRWHLCTTGGRYQSFSGWRKH